MAAVAQCKRRLPDLILGLIERPNVTKTNLRQVKFRLSHSAKRVKSGETIIPATIRPVTPWKAVPAFRWWRHPV